MGYNSGITTMGGRAGGGARGGGAQQRTGFDVESWTSPAGQQLWRVDTGDILYGQKDYFISLFKGAATAYSNARIKGKDDHQAFKIAKAVEKSIGTKAHNARVKSNMAKLKAQGAAMVQAFKEVGMIK